MLIYDLTDNVIVRNMYILHKCKQEFLYQNL